MPSITINNVPSEIVDEIWTSIQYTRDFKFLWKKRPVNNIGDKVEYWDDNELSNFWKSSLITSNSF